mgnify:CR=1 FL=1
MPSHINSRVKLFNEFKSCVINLANNKEYFLYSLEESFKIQPDLICVYPIKTNDYYLAKNYSETKNFFDFYYLLFDEATKKIPEILKKYNYTSKEDFSKLSYVHPFSFRLNSKLNKNMKYTYSNFNVEPYSTLGLGYYSESCINNKMRYTCIDKNKNDSMFLKEFSTDSNAFTYKINPFLTNYDKIKFITYSACENFYISFEDYEKYFKTSLLNDFSYAIKALEYLNVIFIEKKGITFKIKNERELYIPLLFFVGRENVLNKIRSGL